MSSNSKGVSADQVAAGALATALPYGPTFSCPPLANTVHVGDQVGEDLLDHANLYDPFIADDGIIDHNDFDQLFALPNEVDPQFLQFSSQDQDSIPQFYGTSDFPTTSEVGNTLEVNATNTKAEYWGNDPYVDELDVEQSNKHCADSIRFRTVPHQQSHVSKSLMELSNDSSGIITRPESNNRSATSPKKPGRPKFIAPTSSEEYSATSTTSSSSTHIQSTPEPVNPSPQSDLKPRRGRPPLYAPLSRYEVRSQITTSEATSSNELSHFAPAPLSPVSPSGAGAAPAPKPRRGRPPLYARSPTTPTSSQEITREQNRLAARRFRARQEAYMSTLNVQVENLELKNEDLKKEVARLREERLELREGMLEHGKCACDVVEKYLEYETRRIGKRKDDDVDRQERLDDGRRKKDEDKELG